MEDERYTVSQVEQLTGIKGHVLRYWEEELELVIGRNALGHRCYTRYDVQMFLNIKELKSRGLQLRGIKELIPKISQKGPGASTGKVKLLETEEGTVESQKTEERMEQKTEQKISGKNRKQRKADGEEETPTMTVDEDYQWRMAEFQRILERLIVQGLKERNHEERRCRSLDEAIRMHQQTRREAAAAYEAGSRRGRRRFAKRNR